jgi:hypothetical protein
MGRPAAPLLLILLSSVPVTIAACSSHNGTEVDADTEPYEHCVAFVSDASLAAPVSFVASVLPIFQNNCTSGGVNCHGTAGNVPYLGMADGGEDPSLIIASIVNVPSPEDPLMDLVGAGDPAHSYLMHKLDGDQCTLAAGCATSKFNYLSNCGDDMPNGRPALSLATRDIIRSWVKQGAQDK